MLTSCSNLSIKNATARSVISVSINVVLLIVKALTAIIILI